MLSAPTRMAPAASRRSISVASRAAGGKSRFIFEPATAGKPAMSNRFFTANGTPASGGNGSPRARASSSARARKRARSSVSAVNELIRGSRARMRANAASTMLAALARPDAKAAAMSPAVIQAKSNAVVSSTEHRGRLALVRKREAVDERRMLQQELQVEGDAGVPGRLDGQRERLDTRCRKGAHVIGLAATQRPRRRSCPSRRFRFAAYGFAGHAQRTSKVRAGRTSPKPL